MRKKLHLINEKWRQHLLLAVFSLFSMSLWAQSYTIKGKVSDGSGSGVPGVSVRLDGTAIGTTTNNDGDYTLSTTAKAGSYKVSFSSIGYGTSSQSITLGAQTTLTVNVSLKDEASNLDEVVVVGCWLRL